MGNSIVLIRILLPFIELAFLKVLKAHLLMLCKLREHQSKQRALKTWGEMSSVCSVTLVLIFLMIPFYSQKWCALANHLWRRLVRVFFSKQKTKLWSEHVLSLFLFLFLLKLKEHELKKKRLLVKVWGKSTVSYLSLCIYLSLYI